METSGQLFKNKLDKAYSDPSIKMNASTMSDAMKYKQSFKEEKIEGGVADGKTIMSIAKNMLTMIQLIRLPNKKLKTFFVKLKFN